MRKQDSCVIQDKAESKSDDKALPPKRGARRRLLCVVAAVVVLAAPSTLTARPQQTAPAKTESQDQPVRLKTDLIQLRAVVTDKQGKPVTGLGKDDFEITESGRKQVVSFFSAEDLMTTPAPAPVAVKPQADKPALPNRSPVAGPPPRRTIVFFVDSLNMSAVSLLRVKQVLLKFIDERLTDSDMAAVVSSNGSLGLFSQFTQDKQVLRVAVNRLTVSAALQGDSLFTPYLAAKAIQDAGSDQTEIATARIPDPSPPLAPWLVDLPIALRTAMNILWAEENWLDNAHMFGTYKAHMVTRGRELLLRAAYQRRITMLTLKAIAEKLSETPGQRIVFMLSDGFTMQDDSGSMDLTELQPAISRAARAGVVVYTIAARGLTGIPIFDASRNIHFTPNSAGFNEIISYSRQGERELEGGLEQIAAGTGGEAFLTTNDLGGAMAKGLDANNAYYALAYYTDIPPAAKAGEFRKIKIHIKGHPEYKVRTQSGYLAGDLIKEKPAAPADPLKALIKLMGEPLPQTQLHVETVADFLYLSTDQAQVSLTVFIDAAKLGYKEQEGSLLTNPTLLVGILNSDGNTLGVLQDSITIRLSREQLERAKEGMYRYTKRIVLKPGLYQIRLGLRDPQTEQVGTTSAWVEVPDLKSKRLTLSGIQTARAVTDRADENAPDAITQPDVRNGINIFRRADTIVYRGWAYKPALGEAGDGLMIQAQIYEDDRAVLEDTWRPLASFILNKEANAVEFGARLKAAGLKPGLYTLRVRVKEPQSKTDVMKETLFEVLP
jgi:VWFA-related protein